MVKARTKKISKDGASAPSQLSAKERQKAGLKPPWKKGDPSPNPSGGSKDKQKPRLVFWPHLIRYLAMTKAQINQEKREAALTMAQLGAIAFAEKFAEGNLPRQLEILNREIGPPESKPIKSPEEQAALAREYLRQMQASVPENEGVPNETSK